MSCPGRSANKFRPAIALSRTNQDPRCITAWKRNSKIIYSALHSCYHFGREQSKMDVLMAQWSDCPEGLVKGRILHENGELARFRELGLPFQDALDVIMKA